VPQVMTSLVTTEVPDGWPTPWADEEHLYESGAAFPAAWDSVVVPYVYPRNTSQHWVLGQDELWVDYWGHVHLIDMMDFEYKLNVLNFIHRKWSNRDGWYGPLVERLHADIADTGRALDAAHAGLERLDEKLGLLREDILGWAAREQVPA
jgi:hypothetical protein